MLLCRSEKSADSGGVGGGRLKVIKMNEIKIFENEEFGQVRVIEQNGELWFCGKDVAEALGYADTNKALAQHCKDPWVVFCPVGVQTGIDRKSVV